MSIHGLRTPVVACCQKEEMAELIAILLQIIPEHLGKTTTCGTEGASFESGRASFRTAKHASACHTAPFCCGHCGPGEEGVCACSLASEKGMSMSASVLDSMGHGPDMRMCHAPLLNPDWNPPSRDRRTVEVHIEAIGSLYLAVEL